MVTEKQLSLFPNWKECSHLPSVRHLLTGYRIQCVADRLDHPLGDLLRQHVVDADHPAQRARAGTLVQRVDQVAGQ